MSKSVLCVLTGEVQHDSILNGGARGINPEISRIYTRASESDAKNGMRFSSAFLMEKAAARCIF